MENREVLWLNTTSRQPVGLVKVFDEVEDHWKYYIGSGYGLDLDLDIQHIVDWGRKYYDLGFIAEFQEGGSVAMAAKALGVTPERLRELAQADREGRLYEIAKIQEEGLPCRGCDHGWESASSGGCRAQSCRDSCPELAAYLAKQRGGGARE